MKRKLFILIIGAVFLFSTVILNSELHAANKKTLSAGLAKVSVTPKVPIPMSGYGGRKGPFKGVHDDLFARTIVFSDGERKAALVAVEIIGFSDDLWNEITMEIQQ